MNARNSSYTFIYNDGGRSLTARSYGVNTYMLSRVNCQARIAMGEMPREDCHGGIALRGLLRRPPDINAMPGGRVTATPNPRGASAAVHQFGKAAQFAGDAGPGFLFHGIVAPQYFPAELGHRGTTPGSAAGQCDHHR